MDLYLTAQQADALRFFIIALVVLAVGLYLTPDRRCSRCAHCQDEKRAEEAENCKRFHNWYPPGHCPYCKGSRP